MRVEDLNIRELLEFDDAGVFPMRFGGEPVAMMPIVALGGSVAQIRIASVACSRAAEYSN